MAEISLSEVRTLDFPIPAEITDVEHLSSYNWVEDTSPTIAVPGSPALWDPPGGRTRVRKDSGLFYIDLNTARYPDNPLEPLFAALYTTRPSFDILSTDVVTDRSNIRKLLSFVESVAYGDTPEAFTIDIEIHKNTALFSRVEASNEIFIEPDHFGGFGHEFEKAYTRQPLNGSISHHRIISYRFGNMKFVVRHETDGYVGGDLQSTPSDVENQAHGLSEALESLSLTSNTALTDPHCTSSRLVVRQKGQTVPLNCTLEIKTRAIRRPLSIWEVAPQIWLSQTPKLVRAYHQFGKFQAPEVKDVRSDIRQWQANNQVRLRQLVALIRKILDIVKRCDNKATVRYVAGSDNLIISPLTGKEILPRNLYLKWETKPVLRTLVRARQLCGGIIPFFAEVVLGLSKGLRQFFRLMTTRLTDYHVLCNTLELLRVDILGARSLRHIMGDFRSGKGEDSDSDGYSVHGLKNRARDSAFRLLYMFLSKVPRSGPLDKNMAYNAALFVISHRGIFRYRTRWMVLEAFNESCQVTCKQQACLDEWPLKTSSFLESSEDD
ncbi:hypothetical protein F4861DRAFT_533447 [Xylaria intraflava]|nr:hypothetical protein F4861DRAFT_533447 [Xylaria intraflava]